MRVFGKSGFMVVQPFDSVELPKFTVLVGPNGVGKSLFLMAIANGTFPLGDYFGQPDALPPIGIVHLHPGAGLPAFGESVASRGTLSPEPPPMASYPPFDEHRDIILSALSKQLADLVSPEDPFSLKQNYGDFWRAGADAIAAGEGWEETDPRFERLQLLFGSAEEQMIGTGPFQAGQPPYDVRPGVKFLSEKLGISPLSITHDQYAEFAEWGQNNPFVPRVSSLLSTYRDTWLRNALARIEDEESGTQTALSNDLFVAKYGRSPWERLSEHIRSFGLAYNVAVPGKPRRADNYSFHLERLDSKAPVMFGSLSSGEQVLLRIALSLFDFDPVRVQPVIPKLLLFDEMDAALHPQMLNLWLDAIQIELVERRGIECILTTHSPITVALAPEESLYELVEGGSGPQKITKQEALNRLLVGVPTLAIDYSGQRHVFVEGETDAAVYQKLASMLKAVISLPRSLSFIAAGVNGAGDGGCASVTRIVKQLADDGNTSVLGLVDWDGKRDPDGRVHVLGHNTHYAIENVFLNPLMIAAYLIKRDIHVAGLDVPFVTLPDLATDECQRLADIVQDRIEYPPNASNAKVPVRFIGGFELQIRSDYNLMQGHDLEDRLVKAFPALQGLKHGGAGKMALDLVSKVVPELPGFCPEVAKNTLLELANFTF